MSSQHPSLLPGRNRALTGRSSGSFRRTLVRTADDSLVRVQHAATDRVEYAERVRVALSAEPVAVRPRDWLSRIRRAGERRTISRKSPCLRKIC